MHTHMSRRRNDHLCIDMYVNCLHGQITARSGDGEPTMQLSEFFHFLRERGFFDSSKVTVLKAIQVLFCWC